VAGADAVEKPAPLEKPPDKPPQEPTPPAKPAAPEKPIEGLGLFFDTRCVVFNISVSNKEESPVSLAYPFKWFPEAFAELNGKVFAFGKERKERPKDYEEAEKESHKEVVLKCALIEGRIWAEQGNVKDVPISPGPAALLLLAVSL